MTDDRGHLRIRRSAPTDDGWAVVIPIDRAHREADGTGVVVPFRPRSPTLAYPLERGTTLGRYGLRFGVAPGTPGPNPGAIHQRPRRPQGLSKIGARVSELGVEIRAGVHVGGARLSTGRPAVSP